MNLFGGGKGTWGGKGRRKRYLEAVKKSPQTFHGGDAEAQRFENKGSFLCVSAADSGAKRARFRN
jgi:hypothetical protein